MDEESEEFEYDGPSKSQLKRDAKALVELGERLLTIPEDQLPQIELPDVVTAILETKKIKKGNARKRQLQYVGKLLRNSDLTHLEHLIARFDASTDEHATKFHRLEDWRERLIDEDKTVLPEIIEVYPDLDRQHIRALVRNAINERLKEKYPPVHFRKLFQYLKTLMDA